MSTSGEYLRSVVRVFPDYADSVLWFVPGPVDYEDAQLTPRLTRDMKAWEASFYANVTGVGAWRPGFDGDAYEAEGLRLCQCLADELGDVVGVEYRSEQESAKRVILRGTGEGTNPQARAALQNMIAASARWESNLNGSKEAGHILTWVPQLPSKRERQQPTEQ